MIAIVSHPQGVVSDLVSQVKLLDPGQLDLVESRMSVVGPRLNKLAETKENLEQAGKISKVSCGFCLP